jgi:hypothetical protein
MKELVVGVSELSARVVPALGGRIASFSRAGRELLVGPEVNQDNWGSTYWTSPQSAWGWPPVAALDSAPYEVLADQPLRLRSPPALVGGTQVVLEKGIRPSAAGGIELEYALRNVGATPIDVAGWEISRVASGGLTWFETGESALTPIAPHDELVVVRKLGHTFFDHTSFTAGRSAKLHADGRSGFLAHLTPADAAGERLLWLKLFEDTRPAEQAPGEGEIEIFANEDGRYVEVEVQGRYATLEPGATSVFRVEWRVGPVPRGLDVSVGSRELVEFARSLW